MRSFSGTQPLTASPNEMPFAILRLHSATMTACVLFGLRPSSDACAHMNSSAFDIGAPDSM